MILAYNTQGKLGKGTTKRLAKDNSGAKDGDKVIYFEGENENDPNLTRI